ncbi:uncharacterized protein LOC107027014 [Solanum pennellii]|uniref:Uncharacterized protein LOC107027014 n=1 Tax=Solanum pennellii TaxID=28526 RepID=A0ABM1HCU1_SOLPN|nr:uncharacterized protein LOC107027014 [Solanum pennellii]
MEYERIHKVQTGIISPSKLRMKVIGHQQQQKKTKQGSNTNSSTTSPVRRLHQDSEFVNTSLLAAQTQEQYCNYEGRENGGNCSSVHPVKGCEDDYDSTSSFEFHKGERSSMQQHSRSFSRPMSSKWNDAEKWIINRQPNYHSNKIQLHNRGATTSMVKKVDFAPETKDLTEVDSSCLTEDITVGPAIRSVSMRDMGTEMTPIPSQEPSTTATPVGATTPLRSPTSSIPSTPRRGQPAPTPTDNYIDNASQTSTENNKRELSEEELKMKTRKEIVALGVQLGKMNIAAWASKDVKDKSKADAERMEYAKRAAAWEEVEKSKDTARYKREEIKIQAWESQHKAKLEGELRKIEAQVEQMRAQAQAKMVKKIAMARQKSEEKRAAAEARRNQQAGKTTEQVQYIRQTGRLPSSSFTCCGWL